MQVRLIVAIEREKNAIQQQAVQADAAETALAQAKLSRDTQKSYTKIVAATSHDLRTAISAVSSGCNVLAEIIQTLEDKAKCKVLVEVSIRVFTYIYQI